MTARRIGLALGSGGARGWCHIGVIRALSGLGLTADVVAGSSMGALVGAAAAAGRLDALEDWARAQTARSFLRLLDIRLTGGGLVGGSEIVTVIRDLGLPARIEDLPVPFVAVAADLRTGQEVWLREGDLADAVRASVALPGVIAPYRVEGRWLIDGGVVNPVPVSAARALGAGMVIAVDPNARSGGTFWEPEQSDTDTGWTALLPDIPEALRVLWPGSDAGDRPPAYVDLVSSTVDIMTDRIRRARLAGDAPDVFLPMRLSHLSVLEFHRAAEAIEAGARVTRAQADWIAACAGRAEPSA
jgi:NTE family protein